MKKKLTVLVDMDSITVDCLGPWVAAYNEKIRAPTSPILKVEDITNWDMHTLVPEKFKIYDIISEPGFFRHLPPLPGALEGIKALIDAGHDAFLLTAASGNAPSDKAHWVLDTAPFLKDRMIITHGKTPKGLIRGDVIIDDGPHNLISFRESNPNAFVTGIAYNYMTPKARAVADFLVPFTDPEAWPKIVAAVQQYAEGACFCAGMFHDQQCPKWRLSL
jgi:5'-nucleotidase